MIFRNVTFTKHALEQTAKRQISIVDVRKVLEAPEHILVVRPGRVVVQGMAGDYLLRVFVEVDRNPPEVVTAYRTSKIEKYRNKP